MVRGFCKILHESKLLLASVVEKKGKRLYISFCFYPVLYRSVVSTNEDHSEIWDSFETFGNMFLYIMFAISSTTETTLYFRIFTAYCCLMIHFAMMLMVVVILG
jgi:hypothetical protein